MRHKISDIKLPKDSRNSQLEVISKNHFRPLFDVERFILKEEFIDNGVDFRCEIKDEQKTLGFGFNFQLKSSESIFRNKDNSYSKNIETSNIEYLLNNGEPAFYGFYIDNEKQFYYKNLKDVISDLNLKDPNWQDQVNHTIRFSEKLNPESVDEIFQITLADGQMLRKINAAFSENCGLIEKKNNIIIDFDQNVHTDFEIKTIIEKFGLLLTDQCRWNEVIILHEKSTVGSLRTPMYNLVLGISYYYCGEYFRAFECFKESYKKMDSLDSHLKEYLLFFYYSIQRILGIMSNEKYTKATQNFDESASISVYRDLESITNSMQVMYISENYISADFEFRIKEIINNSKLSKHLRLLAKIELVYYKSEQLICRLIPLIEYGETLTIEENFTSINNEYHKILNETEKINSLFINRYCLIRHSRFIIHLDCIVRRRMSSAFLNSLLPKILENIEISYSYFKEINHVENELYSLTILLEYYQNLEVLDKVSEINLIFDSYISEYQNPDFNKKIDFTKESGTFVDLIINMKNNIDREQLELEKMKSELEALDEKEKKSDFENYKNAYVIELFPMGYYQFPKNKIDIVFNILKIENEALKSQFLNMFKIVIPSINCFKCEVEKEGRLGGVSEYVGIKSYRNLYRIRKEMYKHKFFRKEIRFNGN